MSLLKDSQGRSVVPSIINNESLPIDEARLAPVISAASGETIHYFQNVDTDTCNKACDAAWTAFKCWKRATVADRREVLDKIGGALKKRTNEFLAAMKGEISCDDHFVKMNIGLATNVASGISAAIPEVRGMIPANDKTGSTTFVFKESIGPVLVIAPWNVPIFLAVRGIAAAIGAGCTVVMKASEMCPQTIQLIVDSFIEAGVPPGVLNLVTSTRANAPAITETLIANKHIRKIDFIGSAPVGRLIAATAAKYMKPVMMELGGKNAFVVLDDADLDKAAVTAAQSAIMCHGQFCVSADRIIVQRSISEAFIQKLVTNFQAVHPGNAVSENTAQHAYELVKEAKDNGAIVLYGDAELATPVSASAALLQIDPKTDPSSMRIIDEETFGPSAAVYIVDDEEEAIDLVNSSEKGLIAVVHTKDMSRGLSFGRELECGQIIFNSFSQDLSLQAPFGGIKASGYGKTHGIWSLENFYVDRTIVWN